jgi:hypothetical protein
MRHSEFKVIPPRSAAPAKPKSPKVEPRYIEHARHGVGRVLDVRQIDGSDGYMVDVEFADGISRTIRLKQAFWLSDITGPLLEA